MKNNGDNGSFNGRVNPSSKKLSEGYPTEHEKLLDSRDQAKPHNLLREKIGLLVIVLIALGNQWQRYVLAYANGEGAKKNDPNVEIATDYKEYWSDYYGILSGLAFTFTFATFGIFGGVTSDMVSRKMIIIICSIGWSVCTLLSGLIHNFWVFFTMRVLLGLFQAFLNPAAYSIIADYFPPDRRTRANSVFNLAIYFGGAMASVSQILISAKGWRFAYIVIAFIGLGCSVIGVFAIFDPRRGRWEAMNNTGGAQNPQQQEAKQTSTLGRFLASLKEIFTNPTCRWVAIGGFFRFFGGLSIAYFMPKYFGLIWSPDDSERSANFKTAYAICNAFVVSCFGFASAIIGGYVGDVFETKGILMTKAYICIFSGLFGSVFFALCSLVQIRTAGGFALSISMLALEYLTAENWIAPAITMLINTISPENKSFAVGAFLFFCQIGGTIATAIAQPLFEHFDVTNHPERSGYILCVLVLFSYLGSIPFFFLAGRAYSAVKRREIEEKKRMEEKKMREMN